MLARKFLRKTKKQGVAMPRITLTGYIYRDPEGMFVSHCNELSIDTWAASIEEVKRMTPKMIEGYFEAVELLGTMSQTLNSLKTMKDRSKGSCVWSAQPKKNGRFETKFQANA